MTAAPAGVVSLMIMNIIEYLPHLPHLPSRDELENWGPVGKVAWKNSWFQVDRLLIDLTVYTFFGGHPRANRILNYRGLSTTIAESLPNIKS